MKFDVLYIDCPWKFRNEKTGGSHTSGAAQKYPVMELGELKNLPVGALAHPGSLLALWVPTSMKFSHAPVVANAWGFQHYVTTIYWDKQKTGMGFYFRNTIEELLLFACEDVVEELILFSTNDGTIAPFGCQRQNRICLPPGEHSAKPDEFRRLLEDATKKISRRDCVELFARKKVPGWTPVGNQVTGRDVRQDIKLLAQARDAADLDEWPTVRPFAVVDYLKEQPADV